MKKVSFTEMKHGTKEDYLLLEKHEKDFERKIADRILKFMSSLNSTLEGYPVSRLEHSLQTATRALNEAKVQVIPGSLMLGGDNLIRMSYATSLEDLEEGIRRLRTWLNGLI